MGPTQPKNKRIIVALIGSLSALTLVATSWLLISRYGITGLAAGLSSMIGLEAPKAQDDRFQCEVKRQPGSDSSTPRFDITIEPEGVARILAKRRQALAQKLLETGADDFVPAVLEHAGSKTRIRIRLKGDLTDHLAPDCKWSYRIKPRGRNTIMGMKEFSIQHPRTRGYVYEWMLHTMLRQEGLVALRYDFVDVSINGNYQGLLAVEEGFDKRLIENSEYREGPILKFDETLFWRNYRDKLRKKDKELYLGAPIEAFQGSSISKQPLRKNFQEAHRILDAFRSGELPTHEVFSVEKLARFYAVVQVMGAVHAVRWHNLRFYYNPVTSLLEPVGFDGFDSKKHKEFLLSELNLKRYNGGRGLFRHWAYDDLNQRIFADPLFFKRFVKELQRVSQRTYLDRFFKQHGEELNRINALLETEFSFRFTKEPLYANQVYINQVLSRDAGVRAHRLTSSEGALELLVRNEGDMPVELVSVSNGRSNRTVQVEGVILSKRQGHSTHWLRLPVETTPDTWQEGDSIHVHHRILGGKAVRKARVLPAPADALTALEKAQTVAAEPTLSTRQGFLWNRQSLEELGSLDFIEVDSAARRLTIKPGNWSVDRNLVLPSGFTVSAGPDTTLTLRNEASIISFSPLAFEGSLAKPVRITSENGQGRGLVVLSAPKESTLEHVVFSGLSNPSQDDYELTGAVTFYESDVVISNTTFLDARSEDSLNIIRSKFTLKDSRFQGGISDAFDGDFTRGVVKNTRFADFGGDALDMSGGEVVIEDVIVERAGDKGVSGGEGTRLHVRSIDVSGSPIGIASKDRSLVEVEGARIRGAEIGLTAYEKKTEYGPARLVINRYEETDNDLPYMVESGSEIVIDGTPAQPYGRKKQTSLFKWLREGSSVR